MNRSECLDAAANAVNGQREQDYGKPEDNFGLIASLWSALTGIDFEPADVALMLALVKVARIKRTPTHADSWIDMAGYAACGAECATGGGEA